MNKWEYKMTIYYKDQSAPEIYKCPYEKERAIVLLAMFKSMETVQEVKCKRMRIQHDPPPGYLKECVRYESKMDKGRFKVEEKRNVS